MKKLIFILSIFIFACEPLPRVLSGYVVHKEYIEGHMCHSDHKQVNYAVIIVPKPATHVHHWQSTEFNIFVANRNGVTRVAVDSLEWTKYRCGQKVKLTLN